MLQVKENNINLPNPGLGLGLRNQHFDYILKNKPQVDWFEIISENFMDSGGKPRYILKQIVEHYPVVMHGVSLSIGSTDPLNFEYLQRLKNLAGEINPLWISDHLCWTGVQSINSHDLLPVPLNEESLKHICERIKIVQDFLGRKMIFENPSTYLSFTNSTIAEYDFLRMMCEETNCGLLLDVNNVYVSAFNNGFDSKEYINRLPHSNIVQMHIAGHQHCGDYIIDTHDSKVENEVWNLFAQAWQLTGGVATLLEWDNHIPDFEAYHAELLKAKQFMSGFNSIALVKENIDVKEPVSNPVNFMIPEISVELR
jgi:uncharacterized protein (UPF0276 family)